MTAKEIYDLIRNKPYKDGAKLILKYGKMMFNSGYYCSECHSGSKDEIDIPENSWDEYGLTEYIIFEDYKF